MVKIRGYRVELGEVERALLQHPEVKEAAVVAWEREAGEPFLAAYLVLRGQAALPVDQIMAFLRQRLPDYMIPFRFSFLDSLPLINGNQAASLLVYYMLKICADQQKLDGNQFVIKTIVTTDLITDIARKFKVDAYETLTGFKYIAAVIKELEGKKKFIVGGEESYGYLIGDFVRDKDAIASCAMLAEMAAWAKDNGMSIFDLLTEVYKEFGFYQESLLSITRKGKSGAEEIQEMMKNMRANPPKTIHGSPVVRVYDYQSSEVTDLATGTADTLDFPKSNVLQYSTEDGTKISARPSGTEPKIKFYFSVKEPLEKSEDFDKVQQILKSKIESIIAELSLK